MSLLTLLLMVSASAYTVVMRGGRRIEIPSNFVLTRTTLTYEVTPGIQITLQMAAINIAATERANRESPGSFLKRAELPSNTASASLENAQSDVVPGGSRTITNSDLEPAKKRRRESEVAYESRRRQLGLPSVAESRRRDAVRRESIGRELEQTRIAGRETEHYWRGRASALRADIAAVDAELGYTRARLDEVSFSDPGGFTTLESNGPFISYGDIESRQSNYPNARRQPVYVDPRSGPQIGRVDRRRGARRQRGIFNPFPRTGPYGDGYPNDPYDPFPDVAPYGTQQPYDFTYERSALITRFNELAAIRAGLGARWRELEDEARRAGAPPGWLRP
ncbi:MAG: hypothetical protein ABR556_04235 [Pyrinomonadaceae bacterium]